MVKFTNLTLEDILFLSETRNLVAEEFLHDSRKFTLEETIEWFKNQKPDYRIIWINEERVGYFRLSNYSSSNKNIYIGADIHPNFQNRGYGFKSYLEFIPQIFEEYDLHKISLEVLQTNKRAVNLYEKLGFKLEGVKREEVLKGDKYINSLIMSILKDEWK